MIYLCFRNLILYLTFSREKTHDLRWHLKFLRLLKWISFTVLVAYAPKSNIFSNSLCHAWDLLHIDSSVAICLQNKILRKTFSIWTGQSSEGETQYGLDMLYKRMMRWDPPVRVQGLTSARSCIHPARTGVAMVSEKNPAFCSTSINWNQMFWNPLRIKPILKH